MWTVLFSAEVEAWLAGLGDDDWDSIMASVELLEALGPALGRPAADRIKASAHHNMKELRSIGGHLRVLFAFDPVRQAILLIGGDKTGDWTRLVRAQHPARRRALRRLPDVPRRERVTIMAFTKPKTAAEIRAQRPDTPERAARRAALVESLEAEVALHEIRERRGISQAVLAERLEVSRPRVSTIERAGEDLRVSTLERYVAALGGKLRVVATFDDEEIDVSPHGARAD